MSIRYLQGDATDPQGEGEKIIAHICNDAGAWGKGFVVAVSKRWREPEAFYRTWSKDPSFVLGKIQLVGVCPLLSVANMIAQKGLRSFANFRPIRYDALEKCLEALAKVAKSRSASIHMPRIGCGFAGGSWDKVEPLIQKTLITKDIPVTVYDYSEDS